MAERRWQASLAVVAAILLYVSLPEKLTIGPVWVLPVLEGSLVVPLSIVAPRRHPGESWLIRAAGIGLIALVNAANIVSLVLLISELLGSGKGHHSGILTGRTLIQASIQVWLTNVIVFALWYWEIDRGGPGRRGTSPPDFLFPQMTDPKYAQPDWYPTFLDYLYVAFTNGTAFSPTDTMPLTKQAKMLMLAQSLISLLTLALVAARAVNILA